MSRYQDELRKILRGTVRSSEPMSRHTSYRIGGPADIYVEPADCDDLSSAVSFANNEGLPVTVIGRGTNVLVRDGGVRGVVIATSGLKDLRFNGTDARAEAGVSLPGLVRQAINRGLGGLEFAAGIPGSIGGAVTMNAGAHGGAVGNLLKSVLAVRPDGSLQELPGNECEFEYRSSVFRGGGTVVASALFSLTPGDPAGLREEVRDHLHQRRSTQPLGYPNAGSVFKNPSGGSAGRLIDLAGMKGLQVGMAQVSQQHANFIVNLGGATARDVQALIDKIRAAVWEKHGTVLDLEIDVVGEDLPTGTGGGSRWANSLSEGVGS